MKQIKKYLKILLCISTAIALPFALNLFLIYFDFPTAENLNNTHWLGFCGSYLGALIAGIPAYLALSHSRQQSKEQHDTFEEKQRLSVMPVFSTDFEIHPMVDPSYFPKVLITLTGNSPSSVHYPVFQDDIKKFLNNCRHSYKPFNLHIQNLGFGPALNVHLLFSHEKDPDSVIALGNVGSGSYQDIIVAFQNNQSAYVGVTFMDILGNEYTQSGGMDYFAETDSYKFRVISQPELTV